MDLELKVGDYFAQVRVKYKGRTRFGEYSRYYGVILKDGVVSLSQDDKSKEFYCTPLSSMSQLKSLINDVILNDVEIFKGLKMKDIVSIELSGKCMMGGLNSKRLYKVIFHPKELF